MQSMSTRASHVQDSDISHPVIKPPQISLLLLSPKVLCLPLNACSRWSVGIDTGLLSDITPSLGHLQLVVYATFASLVCLSSASAFLPSSECTTKYHFLWHQRLLKKSNPEPRAFRTGALCTRGTQMHQQARKNRLYRNV